MIDVVMFSSGGSQHDAARSLHRLSDQCPEVGPDWPHVQCKGRGQRGTCVRVAKGIVDVIMLLEAPSRQDRLQLPRFWLGTCLDYIGSAV